MEISLKKKRKHKQFEAARAGPCSLLATGRIPREPYQHHRGSRERENSQSAEPGAGGRLLLVND